MDCLYHTTDFLFVNRFFEIFSYLSYWFSRFTGFWLLKRLKKPIFKPFFKSRPLISQFEIFSDFLKLIFKTSFANGKTPYYLPNCCVNNKSTRKGCFRIILNYIVICRICNNVGKSNVVNNIVNSLL